MFKYLIKRTLLMFPTVIGAAVLVFFLLRIVPGDVCEIRLAGTGMFFDQDTLDVCRAENRMDQPLPVQFLDFVGGFLVFDLGRSMWTGNAVSYEVTLRFKLSLQLTIMATVISVLIAIPLGTISATRQDTWMDYAVRSFSVAGIAIPSFWLGIMIIVGLLISTQAILGEPWMPPIEYVSPFEDPAENFAQLIWPAMATGYRFSAVATRMTRSALLEVLREDFIRTAQAKGLMKNIIIYRHALKNAMLPVITLFGIEFAFLMGGLVVTEQVFNLNGLGRLFVESVQNADYTMTQALVMMVSLIFIVTNFIIDIVYAWLDPRIRYG